MDALNILEEPIYDNTIESLQYVSYSPQSQQNLDNNGTPITIDIQGSDAYLLPSKSFIVIKGQLVKSADDTVFAATDKIALVNNAMMFLFKEVVYTINDQIVERINNPGQITSMMRYLSMPDDYSTGAALKSCWTKDTTTHAEHIKFTPSAQAPAAGYAPEENPNYNQGFAARRSLLMTSNPRGSFSFIIPFEMIFGFAEYDKVIYGVKHSLILTRNERDTLAIHRVANVADGKIKLSSIVWRVPHTRLETSKLVELRGIIESKRSIPVAFRARTPESTNVPGGLQNFDWKLSVRSGIEKPRWIILGFQTDKDSSQQQNPAIFDHVSLDTATVTLNGDKYPLYDFSSNFETNDYSILYEAFDNFKKEYYGFNSLVGGTQVNFASYKTLFPLFVFDVRHQSERLKSGVVDMQLKFSFRQAIPQNTKLYALTISDREYKFTSDGKNLTMVTY